MTPLKTCSCCRLDLPANRAHFDLDPRNRCGLGGRCKACRRLAARTRPRTAGYRQRKADQEWWYRRQAGVKRWRPRRKYAEIPGDRPC